MKSPQNLGQTVVQMSAALVSVAVPDGKGRLSHDIGEYSTGIAVMLQPIYQPTIQIHPFQLEPSSQQAHQHSGLSSRSI